MKRAKLAMMKRNVLVAVGNVLAAGDRPVLRRRVEAIAAEAVEDAVGRSTAQAVLSRLSGTATRP
jgi:hypothetical protein